MRKIRNLVLFLFISMILIITVSGNDSTSAYRTDDEAAEILYQMNLFKGTGTDTDGKPTFELDRVSTRYEAITMLVRLSGNEEKALTENYEMPFTDVVDWAKPYVAFAYANGYTSGTSATTFSGDLKITEEQFITMLLRILGYDSSKDFAWDNPWPLSDEISLTQGSSIEGNAEFARGNIAILSERALHCTCIDAETQTTQTLMDKVHTHTWDDGVVTEEATTAKEGSMLFTCTVCQTTKNEKIAKLEVVDEALVISDANLEAALRREINKPTGTLTVSDFAHLTELGLGNCNITDITPLAKLTNIRYLYLQDNNITDITPLAQLSNLTELVLDGNNISDLKPLANLSGLNWLYLNHNNITDLTPLANLKAPLKYLNLNYNNITDLTPLANMSDLCELQLNHNNITDLTPLANLSLLDFLYLDNNNIVDVTPVLNIRNLTALNLNNNHVDIAPFASPAYSTAYTIMFLELENNNLTDITPLANLTNLTILNLMHNNISDITPLANLTDLNVLSLDENNITDWSPVAHVANVDGRP